MATDYHRSVFINCPFDTAFAPLMQAMIFTVVDCGFTPRCALERSDASEIRIQKIYRIIGDCGLGIHDLSRTEVDPHTHLPRFNMPLELGIFLGAKFLGETKQERKACLVFDEKPHRYQMYLSDVAGQDVEWHGNDPRKLVRGVRDWLASLSDANLPSGSIIWDHYLTFQGELLDTCTQARQRPEELTYNDLLRHITAFRRAYVEELNDGGEQTIRNPSAAEIKRFIKSAADDGAPVVVFGKGSNGLTYIQGCLDANALWTIEFQDGHISKHFRAMRNLSTEEVVQLFLSYANAEDHWRNVVEWEPMDV